MAPADTLVCDTAQVAAWQSDPAFAYSRELIACLLYTSPSPRDTR